MNGKYGLFISHNKVIIGEANNYLNESWKKLFKRLILEDEIKALKQFEGKAEKRFERLSREKKIKTLSKDEMISLLYKRKKHLSSRKKLFSKYRDAKMDLLDRLTFEWCEEATLVSLSMIEKGLKYLSDINSVVITQETEEKFLEAWNGIYCYDFKTYDYYKFDYDKESVFDVQT